MLLVQLNMLNLHVSVDLFGRLRCKKGRDLSGYSLGSRWRGRRVKLKELRERVHLESEFEAGEDAEAERCLKHYDNGARSHAGACVCVA